MARIADIAIDWYRGLGRGDERDAYRVLRYRILPFFAERAEFDRILVVGCAWYTRGLNRALAKTRCCTLDSDPSRRRHGAARHIVDGIENIERHFHPESLDVIVLSGVFGWGLDDEADLRRAARGCLSCLRPGGLLVFGWNDSPTRRPFDPIASGAFDGFDRYDFPPLGSSRFGTSNPNRHVFDFLQRPIPVRD